MDVEAEIRDLKRRVGDLEGAFSVLTGQIRNVQPDLQDFRTETQVSFERFGTVLSGLDGKLESFLRRMDRVELQVWSIRDDLPELVKIAFADGRGRTPPAS